MYISKSGKLLIAPQNNLTNITVNGQTVSLEGPTSTPELNLYYYLIKCGPVERVLFENAGAGCTNPILTASGLTFGTPVIRTGIVDYKILSGTNIPANPYFFLSPPYGVGDFVLVKPSASVDISGSISVKSSCNNVVGFGYSYYPDGVNPIINVDCGLQSAPPQVITTVISGALISAIIPQPYFSNCGNNYPPDTIGLVSDATGSGAVIKVFLNGALLNNINVISGGSNYTNPFITLSRSGEMANILPIVDTYIGNVDVLTSNYFYSPPHISVNFSGIIAVPIMGGIQNGDVVTYSGVTIPREFTGKPAMKAGFNLGAQPSYPNSVNYTAKNRYQQGAPWQIFSGEGHVSTLDDGTPTSWTSPFDTILRRWMVGTNADNRVDSYGTPSPIGLYTVKYVDPCVNSSSGAYVLLYANAPYNVLNLSGPNHGNYSGITIQPDDITYNFDGGITSLTTTHTNLGSGYTGAIAVCSNNIVVQPLVQNGVITSLNLICQGINITSEPSIVIYGTDVSSGVTTQQINVFYNNPSTWEIDIALLMAQNQGKFNLQNIYVSDPDPYTRLPTAIDLQKPLATQDGVLKAFTPVNGKVPDIIRFMDVNQGYGGFSNFTTPENLPSPFASNWSYSSGIDHVFFQARFVNTDPANTGYPWLVNKIYGDLPWMLEGPDDFGKYLTLSSNDFGYFTGNYFAGNSVVMELIGSEHTFKSGQNINIYTAYDTLSIPVTNRPNLTPLNPLNGYVWVTGPSSIIVNVYMGSVGISTDPLQTIDSHSIVNMTGGLLVFTAMGGGNSAPYEYSPTLCKDLGNTACYLNIPMPATPPLTQKLAQIMNDNLGQNNDVYIEYSNEIWNGGFVSNGMITPAATLYTYLGIPWYNFYGGTILLSAYNYEIFINEWLSLGRSRNSVKAVYGSFIGNPDLDAQILETCQQVGAPIDHICVAPYYDINFTDTTPLTPFFTPIGAGGSGWPPGAINDVFRTWMLYSPINTGNWASHQNVIKWWGQPVRGINWSLFSTTSGSIPAGRYTPCYTYVDGQGNETTIGNSVANSQGLDSDYQLNITLPPIPIWASGLNVYLKVDELDSQPILYSGVPRNSFNAGQSLIVKNWAPSAPYQHPPLVNNASGHIQNYPSLITYEGATQNIIPNSLSLAYYIVHDCNADPSAADRIYDWYISCQSGGCDAAIYYQCYGAQNTYDLWALSFGTNQFPGSGTANKFSIEDGRDHNAGPTPNESTLLQGFSNFMNITTEVIGFNIAHNKLPKYLRVRRY